MVRLALLISLETPLDFRRRIGFLALLGDCQGFPRRGLASDSTAPAAAVKTPDAKATIKSRQGVRGHMLEAVMVASPVTMEPMSVVCVQSRTSTSTWSELESVPRAQPTRPRVSANRSGVVRDNSASADSSDVTSGMCEQSVPRCVAVVSGRGGIWRR